MTQTLLPVELNRVAWWRLRIESLNKGGLRRVTDFEKCAVVRNARAIFWHLVHVLSLQVQVEVMLVLEVLATVAALPQLFFPGL